MNPHARVFLFRLSTSRRQRGFTMVELLVGIAISLFLAATAATLLAGHLRENRGLLLEARLMQDLRTAADVITRDVRRAGYWRGAASGVWNAGGVAPSNPYAAFAPSAGASDAVRFTYSRDPIENDVVDTNERFGFRLRNAAIEIELGADNWQALTDATTLLVTSFSVTPRTEDIELGHLCVTPCPTIAAGSTCPPRQSVRSLAIAITGRLAGDASVLRSIHSLVRVRNDAIVGACAV